MVLNKVDSVPSVLFLTLSSDVLIVGVRWQVDLDLAGQLIDLATSAKFFIIIVHKWIAIAFVIECQLVCGGILMTWLSVQVAIIDTFLFVAGLLLC